MNALSFLSQVTVSPVVAPKKAETRTPKQRQPLEADLRVWSSGAIYPSDALVAEFNLAYQPKDAEEKGFGFDIINISEMPQIQSAQPFIAISATPRTEARIDIFSSSSFDENGCPRIAVEEQGAATFGKETLLPLLKEVYGIEPNEEGFIDLNIHRDMPFNSPNGIYRFPKTVSRGVQKGEITYQRRENQTVFALLPVALIKGEEEPSASSEEVINNTDLSHEGTEVENSPEPTETVEDKFLVND